MGNAGAYVRPFHFNDRELKTGINISWMDFSKNLSNFSYGQGATSARRTISAYRSR